jgi:hypothetical protein
MQRLGLRRGEQGWTLVVSTPRMEREASAEPEADWQAEAPEEVEMELQ